MFTWSNRRSNRSHWRSPRVNCQATTGVTSCTQLLRVCRYAIDDHCNDHYNGCLVYQHATFMHVMLPAILHLTTLKFVAWQDVPLCVMLNFMPQLAAVAHVMSASCLSDARQWAAPPHHASQRTASGVNQQLELVANLSFTICRCKDRS